ncbi:enoyl-CoA hydratase [Martiniozyma asiatica (nom. inval.)]|nr:enoyl-CoA hydratase [Martiniozyma asiatica]
MNQTLILYNVISGSLWGFVLFNFLSTALLFDQPELFQLTYKWTTAVQCLAVIEIFNSAVGIVRSPLFTTALQVSSRLLIVLGVWWIHPESSGNYTLFYSTVHLAWGITEIIRYYYYALNLIGNIPAWLEFLRYNAFIVLYPLGITSECAMVYQLLPTVKGHWSYWFYVVVLAVYVPGTFVLFSHMLSQRRKKGKPTPRPKSL